MYVMALRRLRRNQQLNDKVIDTCLAQICTKHRGIKRSGIAGLYTKRFMNDNFNYINDTQKFAQLGRRNLYESDINFPPI